METRLVQTIEGGFAAKEARFSILPRERSRRSHLAICREAGARREAIEAFISRAYRRHFDACVREFMPSLAALYDERGGLKAAVGYRAAAEGPLFLEVYTNGPIEQVIRRQTGVDVDRSRIVEVGSLACEGGRAAMEIVTRLAPALIEEGFSWVVFTGADTVRNVFRRLNLKPVALCIANKSVLGDRQSEWGTYYDHNPVVMAGRIEDGIVGVDPVAGAR